MRTIDATKCSCGQLWMSTCGAKRHTASCPAGGHLTRVPVAYTLVDALTTYTEWASTASAITTIDARSLIERVYADRGDVFDRIVEGPFTQRLVWFFELFILGGARCIAEYSDAYVIKTDDGVVKLPNCDATLTWLVRFVVKAYDTIVADSALPDSRIKSVWSRTTRLPGLREHRTYDDLIDVDAELPDEIRDFGAYIETHTPRLGAPDAADLIKVWTCPACWWSHPVRSKTSRHVRSCRHIDGPTESTEPVEPVEPVERTARFVRIDPVDRKRSRNQTKIPIECIEIETPPGPEMTLDELANMVRSFTKSIEHDGGAFLLTVQSNTPDGTRVERLDRFRLVQRVLAELERKLCNVGCDVVESSRVVHDLFSRNWKFSSTFSSTLFELIDAETEPPGAAGFIARVCQVLGGSSDSGSV